MENTKNLSKIDEHSLIAHGLRKARKHRGLSQDQIANRTGLTAKYISLIETGARMPSLAVLMKILAELKYQTIFLPAELNTLLKKQLSNLEMTAESLQEVDHLLNNTLKQLNE